MKIFKNKIHEISFYESIQNFSNNGAFVALGSGQTLLS